jgi:hypothetical protein
MEPYGSLPCSLEPATGPYTGADEWSPHPYILFKIHFNTGIPRFTSLIHSSKTVRKTKTRKTKINFPLLSEKRRRGTTIGLREEGARTSENWLVYWKTGINLCITCNRKLVNRLLLYRGITVLSSHLRLEVSHVASTLETFRTSRLPFVPHALPVIRDDFIILTIQNNNISRSIYYIMESIKFSNSLSYIDCRNRQFLCFLKCLWLI